MADFLALIFSLPLAVLTGALVVVLLYWVLVILGALDVEVLDMSGVHDALDGLLEGAEGAAGAAAGAEAAATTGGGAAADAIADAAAAGTAGTTGPAAAGIAGTSGPATAADAAHSTPHPTGAGGLAGLLAALGLAGVPFTVSLSVLVFLTWLLAVATAIALRSAAPAYALGPIAGTLLMLGAFVVALVATGFVVRPLRPAFVTRQAPRRREAVGRLCTVLSSRVDRTTGRAEIDDGGAGLLAEVRCFEPNELTRGSRALVFDYDAKAELYHVVPADAMLERERSAS